MPRKAREQRCVAPYRVKRVEGWAVVHFGNIVAVRRDKKAAEALAKRWHKEAEAISRGIHLG